MGWRPTIVGRRVIWKQDGPRRDSREEFMKYLDKTMEFAGTASLSLELPRITPDQLKIGDAIIEGGFPGHAVLILDMVENEKGERLMILGQSYIPAQDFHVLKNPQNDNTPWFRVNFGDNLVTPEWTFQRSHCRTFNLNGIQTRRGKSVSNKNYGAYKS